MNEEGRARRVVIREWERRGPHDDPALRNRFLEDEVARSTAMTLLQQGMLRLSELRAGLEVRSTSYVGHVRVGSLDVTVRPKIGWDGLLKLARYTYGISATEIGPDVAIALEEESLADLLVLQLCSEARSLIARGRHRDYRTQRRSLTAPRGRLDLPRLAMHDVSGGVGLPCILRPRSEDVPLNRAIVAGLRIGVRAASLRSVKNEAARSAAIWSEGLGEHQLTGTELERTWRGLNRLSEPYRPALQLVEALLTGTGISLEEQNEQLPLPGFLFDMNGFFQRFLSRFLKEFLEGFTVRDEHTLRGMLRYAKGANPKGRPAPSPRPDFAVQSDGRTIALLDAKYRDLWENNLPREMLYQLATYALSQPAGFQAAILYPSVSSEAAVQRIEINDPVSARARATIELRAVPIVALQELLTDLRSRAARQQCRQIARLLAFGAA
jgi:5-methylcytosine-specific restriction enzyme subunit McrC